MSTWRLTSLRAAVVPVGDAKWRLTSLRGAGTPLEVTLVTLAGPTEAEPNETVTITAITTGGTPTAWIFTQTGGVTVSLTGTGASRSFVAPALSSGTILDFQVTVSRPGVPDASGTLEISVWAAAEYIRHATSWEPRVDYVWDWLADVLDGGSGFSPDGLTIIDGGTSSSSGSIDVLEGGSA